MALPPEAPAVNAKDTWRLPGVTTSEPGALAVVAGVAVTVDDAVPVPTALIAETLKVYSVPLLREVMVSDVRVLAERETSLQLEAISSEEWQYRDMPRR